MKKLFSAKATDRRKHRLAFLITAGALVAVLIFNVLFTLIQTAGFWYIDETYEEIYTLSKDCEKIIKENALPMVDRFNEERTAAGKDAIKINIIFCAAPDILCGTSSSRYVYYTALEMQDAFPDYISVSWINIKENPSAVQKYKTNSSSTIYSSNVIVEFGTEFRVYALKAFFTYSEETSTTPWAYSGEKKMTSGILAVTKADSPICALTVGHGEDYTNYTQFIKVVEAAGYEVMELDLAKDDIPDTCRLIITVDPKTDFLTAADGSSEISKLDKFLDSTYSYMVFFNPETPNLPNLEEYLEEWGILFARKTDEKTGNSSSLAVSDPTSSLTQDGLSIIGSYTTEGLGASFTSDMRGVTYPSKVVFPSSGAIMVPQTYTTTYVAADDTNKIPAYSYNSYYHYGVSRQIFNLFTSTTVANATAADGSVAGVIDSATETSPYRLMTITRESRTVQESNYTSVNEASYVCACASTAFISDTLLSSAAYGNTDVMLSVLRNIGKEVLPVKLDFKIFTHYTPDSKYVQIDSTTPTVWLTVIPTALALFGGVFVLVRRKYAH